MDIKVMRESVLDQLYASPPEDFVRLRNEQAKKLAAEGEQALSSEVKKLARPTVIAWALNQLAREHGEQVSELLAAGQELEKAHRRLLSGVEAHGLQETVKKRRELLHRVEGLAVRILEKSGRSADPHRAAIAATLQTASSDRQAAETLQKGRFTKELPPPSGFGNLTGLSLVPRQEEEEETSGKRERPQRKAAREVRADSAKGARKKTDREREKREAAERERKEREEAARQLALAKARLAEAHRTAGTSARRAESARKRADRAGEDAERIEARARRARELAAQLKGEAEAMESAATEASRAENSAAREVKDAGG